MNRCPNCAAQNREGAKFCTSCGFRLPAESAPLTTSERSPFATTSTVPPYEEPSVPPSQAPTTEPGFATWNTPPADEAAPGLSWNAAPPPNTSVPVSDDMIASLVADADQGAEAADAESAVDRRIKPSSSSIDHALKLVRDLEYELIELAEATPGRAGGDSRLLANAIADLQDEDDLAPLRNAVTTAQERPRDVDVMLDLVLRADALSALLTERDQLKSAIILFLADQSGAAEGESADGEPGEGGDATGADRGSDAVDDGAESRAGDNGDSQII